MTRQSTRWSNGPTGKSTKGIVPSCQLAVGYEGEIVREVTLGETPAGDDTRYTIFSSTKAIVASAIWQLLAEGAIRLEDRVADHIPEFGTNGKDVVTVEQVLLHTSGFPRAPLGPPAVGHARRGGSQAFSKWRLNWEPGTPLRVPRDRPRTGCSPSCSRVPTVRAHRSRSAAVCSSRSG